jgi:hypothetical protein
VQLQFIRTLVAGLDCQPLGQFHAGQPGSLADLLPGSAAGGFDDVGEEPPEGLAADLGFGVLGAAN